MPTLSRPLHLHNVLVTPNIIKNLIYVRQFTRDNKCIVEFDEFGFSVKDFLNRLILLRCNSSGDLYPVTKPSHVPSVLLSVSPTTLHQRLGHPGADEAEYRVVANVVAKTAWLRNLFRELHTPLLSTTLANSDNVRVLHVPSCYQYDDIFTKGLPSTLFEEFRTSLSVQPFPAQAAGECNLKDVWSLDSVLQDAQLLLDEGSCYRIGNFRVGDNSAKYPLLNHKYKVDLFKNTYVTRVASFDNNPHGFKFEPFPNFHIRKFTANDVVDVIGTVVSIFDSIPFNNYGEDKVRRSLILEDVEGRKKECCFFNGWAAKFDILYLHREKIGYVVMILQLVKVKYFNEKSSVNPALYSTKLYNEIEGYDPKNHSIVSSEKRNNSRRVFPKRREENDRQNLTVLCMQKYIKFTASTDGLTWDVKGAAVRQHKLITVNLRPVLLRAGSNSSKNGPARSMAQ
ncbi:replication protein A 70 kDa DNA-binding subunit B [Tanacetum coccineum]